MGTESSGGLWELAGNRGETRGEFTPTNILSSPKVCLLDSLGETKSDQNFVHQCL